MTTARQQLLEITATHIKLLTELDAVLQTEADALGNRDLNGIQSATDLKNRLLTELEGAGQALTRLCREAGVQPHRSGLTGAGVTAAMAHAWSRMCQLIERCEQKNRLNGLAINASRNFAENLLALLQGQQTSARTYGRKGTLYREPPATALGSA